MPKQTSVQLTPNTKRQVQWLQEHGYGSFTDIVRIAIDRLYIAERPSDADLLRLGSDNVKCATCGRPVAPQSHWQSGIYGEVYCPDCSDTPTDVGE
jgi:hypothetical protein